MSNYSEDFWESSWNNENSTELYSYLDKYNNLNNKWINFLKDNGVKTVCDAACGFGAYTLAFASNGFDVQGFDISKTAVDITKKGLKKYGYNSIKIKVASIIDTGYKDSSFDGVIAHSVLDHLTVEDAKKSLNELYRITKDDGLIMVSFDSLEEDDLKMEHIILKDGSFQYTGDNERKNMIFHPYDDNEIITFLNGYNIVFRDTAHNGNQILILKKQLLI